MATRPEAYVDTSALIAFVDRSDTYHPLFRLLFSDPPGLVTTTLVAAEGHGWFLRRYDRTRALRFISLLEIMTPLRVIPTGPDELTGAVNCCDSSPIKTYRSPTRLVFGRWTDATSRFAGQQIDI